MFLHWLVGMIYVFYFASFILLLREVLRPGVLWFLRNLNDPDFNPIQEVGFKRASTPACGQVGWCSIRHAGFCMDRCSWNLVSGFVLVAACFQ